jgi:hypothetical protein
MIRLTPGHIESDGHVVLIGPLTGDVTLADGTTIDVSPVAVEVATVEEADEVAHLVALRYVEEGHPDDVEVTEDGVEQYPFDYVAPEALADYQPYGQEG